MSGTVLTYPIVIDHLALYKMGNPSHPPIPENLDRYIACWGKKFTKFQAKYFNCYLEFDFENYLVQNQLKRFGKVKIYCPHCYNDNKGYVEFDKHCMDEVITDHAIFEVNCIKCNKEFAVIIYYGEFI